MNPGDLEFAQAATPRRLIPLTVTTHDLWTLQTWNIRAGDNLKKASSLILHFTDDEPGQSCLVFKMREIDSPHPSAHPSFHPVIYEPTHLLESHQHFGAPPGLSSKYKNMTKTRSLLPTHIYTNDYDSV